MMQTEILSLEGNTFEIWYESPIYRKDAINELYRQLYIKKLQTNLVQNPGFETAASQYLPANWWNGINSGAATFPYDSVAKTPAGKSGIGAGIILSTTGDAYWAQTINGISPSTIYSLTAYANTQNVTGYGVYSEVDWFDASMNYISGSASTSNPLTGTTSWSPIPVNSTSPPNASNANVILRLQGMGTVTFDDVSFTSGGGGGTPPTTQPPTTQPPTTQPPTTRPPGGTTPPPGGTTPPPGSTPPVTCPSGQINIAGSCIPKNYLIYGGVGLVLLMVLKK